MLFSSFPFIVAFLPLSLLIYFLLSKINAKCGLFSLVALSTVFYGWNNPTFLFWIYLSISLNFLAAKIMVKGKYDKKMIFIGTLIFNVSLLIFFKYLSFFTLNINTLFQLNLPVKTIELPLAISFFTFQQIGFLVDVYKKEESLPRFMEYSSFIIFFPQLIAGPIVKHSDYLPQIQQKKTFKPNWQSISIGFTIFTLGLFKKTILADKAGLYADFIYDDLLANGVVPNFFEGWLGVFAYAFQIYFDFSGYSDMAIGLARLFNIELPINFFSPYKSSSIIEFWRRWHISLSSFLKEYIYIPLGGNKKGKINRYRNLLLTMLIGGLWHGASWTFVIWGALHGFYLVINHLWKKSKSRFVVIKTAFTFVLVALTWIFFRAKTVSQAFFYLGSLFNPANLALRKGTVKWLTHFGLDLSFLQKPFHVDTGLYVRTFNLCVIGAVIVFFLPNLYQWMKFFRPASDYPKELYIRSKFLRPFYWRPTLAFGIIIFMILVYSFGSIDEKKEFIYFQF